MNKVHVSKVCEALRKNHGRDAKVNDGGHALDYVSFPVVARHELGDVKLLAACGFNDNVVAVSLHYENDDGTVARVFRHETFVPGTADEDAEVFDAYVRMVSHELGRYAYEIHKAAGRVKSFGEEDRS